MFNNSDFKPVIPNIVDHTMREPDKDVQRVMEANKKRAPATPKSAPTPPPEDHVIDVEDNGPVKPTGGNPLVRKIFMGGLIVSIIILSIILIYQIYKHYTSKETEDPKAKPKGGGNPQQVQAQPQQQQPDPKQQEREYSEAKQIEARLAAASSSSSSAPRSKSKPADPFASMDDDYLNSFLTKTQQAEPTTVDSTSPVAIHRSGLVEETHEPDVVDEAEMARISTLIDEAKSDGQGLSNQDQLAELRAEMDAEQNTATELEALAREQELGGDLDSLDYLVNMDTCQFVITKGKRKGDLCGKSTVVGDRCANHKGK